VIRPGETCGEALQARHTHAVFANAQTGAPVLPYFVHMSATWVNISRSQCPVQVAETAEFQQELPSLALERK
jgi:hypothetical protein